MTRAEFAHELDRLYRTYGEKSYPPERTQVIWNKLQSLDASQFTDIVSDLIGECHLPPMLSKFEEAAKKYFAKHPEKGEAEVRAWAESSQHCALCNKSGVVQATKEGVRIPFAFRCRCEIGKRMSFAYPEWSDTKYGGAYSPMLWQDSTPRHVNPEKLRERASYLLKSMPKETEFSED